MMLFRTVITLTLFLVFAKCKAQSLLKFNNCDYCKHFTEKGFSPYEILMTLREGMDHTQPAPALKRRMLMLVEDIIIAEGVFVEYCRHNCKKDNKIKKKDEASRSSVKKEKSLRSMPLEGEEKFTNSAKNDLMNKNKKKSEIKFLVNYLKKKLKPAQQAPEDKTKNPTPESKEDDEKPLTLYQNLSFGLELPQDLPGKSKYLQDTQNSNNDGRPVGKVFIGQFPDISVSKLLDLLNGGTVELEGPTIENIEVTSSPNVENLEPTKFPKPETADKENEEFNISIGIVTDEPEETTSKTDTEKTDGIENLVTDGVDLGPTHEGAKTVSTSDLKTSDFLKCAIELMLTETEKATGIPLSLLIRERCGKKLEVPLPALYLHNVWGLHDKNTESQTIASTAAPPVQNIQKVEAYNPNKFVGHEWPSLPTLSYKPYVQKPAFLYPYVPVKLRNQ